MMEALQISNVKIDLSADPAKINFQALQKLNESEKAIIQASRGIRIKDLDLDTFTESVGELIKNVHLRLGYRNFETSLIEEQQILICQDLLRYYKLLTFEEINIVIDNALSGEYSKEVFFAPAYLTQWIKKYLEQKAEANKKHINYLNALEENKPIPTVQEMDETMQKVVLNHFFEMSNCENGVYEEHIFDYGGVLYEFLERKHTALSKDRKFEIYNFFASRYPNLKHEEIIKKCKQKALVEMLRISHNNYLNAN